MVLSPTYHYLSFPKNIIVNLPYFTNDLSSHSGIYVSVLRNNTAHIPPSRRVDVTPSLVRVESFDTKRIRIFFPTQDLGPNLSSEHSVRLGIGGVVAPH